MNDEKKLDMKKLVLERKADVICLLLGVALGIYFDWSIVEIIIFLVFIWSILWSIPSRFLVGPAIFFLALTPLLLMLDRKERAEEFAIYTYYFLAMAVIRGIIEVRKEKTD